MLRRVVSQPVQRNDWPRRQGRARHGEDAVAVQDELDEDDELEELEDDDIDS